MRAAFVNAVLTLRIRDVPEVLASPASAPAACLREGPQHGAIALHSMSSSHGRVGSERHWLQQNSGTLAGSIEIRTRPKRSMAAQLLPIMHGMALFQALWQDVRACGPREPWQALERATLPVFPF